MDSEMLNYLVSGESDTMENQMQDLRSVFGSVFPDLGGFV